MPLRDLRSRLNPGNPESLARQLACLLAGEVLDGRLPTGNLLPGSRSLADDLGVSRHVIFSALRLLEQDGWVECRPRSGTYVLETVPASIPRSWGSLPESITMPEAPAFHLPSRMEPVSSLAETELDLTEGRPDARLSPQKAIGRGYQRALNRHGNALLGKGESRGNLFLREQLAEYLGGHRGLKVGAENLMITRGTPMALILIASTLLPDGGDIAVEDPGHRVAWEALRSVSGVRLHPVPVDRDGLDVEALDSLLSHQHLDLLYITPHFQMPTTVTLAAGRRSQLLALARQHHFAVLEDDPEFEYYGSSGPILPLANADTDGLTIHLGSLTQLLAPGLGLGFIVAPKALVDRLARVRQRMDVQGDRVLEWALADLIRDGDFDRHLGRTRPIYTERRDAFLSAIRAELGPAFEIQAPNGGLACWMRVPSEIDPDALSAACRTLGVKFHPGRHHDFHGRSLPFVHLGFGALDPAQIQQAIQSMRKSLENLTQRNS